MSTCQPIPVRNLQRCNMSTYTPNSNTRSVLPSVHRLDLSSMLFTLLSRSYLPLPYSPVSPAVASYFRYSLLLVSFPSVVYIRLTNDLRLDRSCKVSGEPAMHRGLFVGPHGPRFPRTAYHGIIRLSEWTPSLSKPGAPPRLYGIGHFTLQDSTTPCERPVLLVANRHLSWQPLEQQALVWARAGRLP